MTRSNPKSLNKTAAEIAVNARAEKERKAASKAALKAARALELKESAPVSEPSLPQTPIADPVADAAKAAADHEAYVAALTVDAKAILGEDAPQAAIDAYIAEQSAPVAEAKVGYTGPMLILRKAAKSYVKADNGILCNGDGLATVCGKYTRPIVVAGLSKLMNEVFPGFGYPYAHLNPGQQSMNLRNKTRHALKNGLVQSVAVVKALEAAAEAAKAHTVTPSADVKAA